MFVHLYNVNLCLDGKRAAFLIPKSIKSNNNMIWMTVFVPFILARKYPCTINYSVDGFPRKQLFARDFV